MKPLKIVFDTNVYLAMYMRPDSYSAQWLQKAQSGTFALYTSAALLDELYEKLVGRAGLSDTEAAAVLLHIQSVAQLVYPLRHLQVITEDPDDDRVLECAVQAEADLIISADKDLLKLKEFETIKIIHPSTMKYLYPE